MPVTIQPAAHEPKAHPRIDHAGTLDEFLRRSCPDSVIPGETRIEASSFGNSNVTELDANVYPSSSSFVRCAIEAWGRHAHLKIRPDDVWFTILTQMNFFMQRNSESLRDLFVPHQDKETIHVEADDWSEVVEAFRARLQKKIKTPWMAEWISPGFSTSSLVDEQTATVLMMGLMKDFFHFEGGITCGIPSITLLGTKEDWQRLLRKIERLEDFGPQPKSYGDRLRPLLTRFVSTFDDPVAEETKVFWDQMVQARVFHQSCCGLPPTQYLVSGWVLGFFYWDKTGDVNPRLSQGMGMYPDHHVLKYDDMPYGTAPLDDIPIGYAKAPFELVTGPGAPGAPCKGWILAGSIGKLITEGASEGYKPVVAKTSMGRNTLHTSMTTESDCAANCFAGIVQVLSRFRSSKTRSANEEETFCEKAGDRPVEGVAECEHSTIQPLSGWFLFHPDKDPGPFYDDEEVSGQTVDAINSCEGVKHENEDEGFGLFGRIRWSLKMKALPIFSMH